MADPDERTAAVRIDGTRKAARSLTLLLEAIERGDLGPRVAVLVGTSVVTGL
jgi:hypothetical protein